ncbi:Dyp-type peroxidase [Rhodococcus sp. NPDC058532]|uniref:Dyp-type peroxidase n=1 Tax=Rhodococcus sp. NPDC058532 TaxID=3346540 RepID=UPI00365D16F4
MPETSPAAATPEPQTVSYPLTPAAVFLVVTINDDGEDVARRVLAEAAGLRRSVGLRVPGAGLELIVSIGSAAWDRLFTGPRPAALHPFPALRGGTHQAPSTPGDLLFHIRAMTIDACFELAHQITKRLGDAVTVVDEVHGFQYFENRDLIGFVDGTENPSGTKAVAAVTVGAEDPHFAGGSYVHVQRYVHDLVSWEALPVPEQENVIGRTKLEDIEMGDDVKPANSHVALTAIKDEQGNALEILRANLPYGRVGGEMGTYFIGYCKDPAVTERMLENMFLGDPRGNYDRLLDFSVAVTGSAFFTPSADFFDALPAAPA